MKELSNELQSFVLGRHGRAKTTNREVRSRGCVTVKSYRDLVSKVAELSFYNPEHVLFFRGQTHDHSNEDGLTTLHATMFRPKRGNHRLTNRTIETRFQRLQEFSNRLKGEYVNQGLAGQDRIRKHNILRWAILQHYEICRTPLLDLTHSLRVACSFAFDGVSDEDPYLFVLALPNVSGSVTSSSEHGVQIIRLLSICPPSAMRPHIQEAYVVGEYPTVDSYEQKIEYSRGDVDFARRLLCKFRLKRNSFWSPEFTKVEHSALYPNQGDVMFDLATRVMNYR